MARGDFTALSAICGNVRRFTKGNVILFQGEAPRTAFLIQEGTVRVYAIDDNGEEYIVGFYGSGDVFPIDWLHGHGKSAMFYYEAMTPTSLLSLERPTYDAHKNEPEIAAFMRGSLVDEAASGLMRSLALQQARAKDKIIYLFYYLALRHGKETANGLYSLGLPLTHQTIASCLGLTRETVATELGQLKRAGAVAYRNKKYIVDKQMVIRTVGKEIAAI